MVKVRFTNGIFVKGIQYAVGGIDLVSEGDALSLYGKGKAKPHLGDLIQDKLGLPMENNFSNVHGKKV